jgi:hypothetical protein
VASLLLRIDGLSRHDEERVDGILRPLPGIYGVLVSASAGRVEVDLADDEIDLDRILRLLEEAGYHARICG